MGDLVGVVRLFHHVLGFLTQLSATELKDVAEGRRGLRLDGTTSPESAAPRFEPTPRARSAARRSAAAGDDVDYAEIAAKLRACATVDEGAAYLDGLRLRGRKRRKGDLVRVGAEMGQTLKEDSQTDRELVKRLVDHAIGAKRKYAGLTKW